MVQPHRTGRSSRRMVRRPSKLNSLSKKGKWEEMTAAVSDDVVRLFAAVGRYEEIAAQIEQRFGGVADIVALPEDTPGDLLRDIENIG